jgi:hypothetical protein
MTATLTELERHVARIERDFASWRRDAAQRPIRKSPPGAMMGKMEFAVVREIGTGTEPFIMVQRLRQISVEPWWAWASDTYEKVGCYSDLPSAEYGLFVSTLSGAWVPNATCCKMIPLVRCELSWVALPWTAPETIDINDLQEVARTDCYPPVGGGSPGVTAPFDGGNGNGGLTPADLDDLVDVTISGDQANDEILGWDLASEQWVNQTKAELGIATTSHAATHMPGGSDILQVSATSRILGRSAAGAGDVQEMGPIVVRSILNVEDGAEVNVVDSVFGRTGAVVAAANDYTWAQVDKTTSSLADLATRAITDLSDVASKTGTGTKAVFSDSPVFTTQITTPQIYSNSDILIDAYNFSGDRTLQIYNSSAGQCNVTIDGTLAVAQAVTVPTLNVTANVGTNAIVLDSDGTYSTIIQSQTVIRDVIITLPAADTEVAGLGIVNDWPAHQVFSFTPGSISVAQRIQHQGDVDTYVEFTSDAVAVYAGGVLMLSLNEVFMASRIIVNDGGADVDFTVEGDTSQYLLQCDAGNDNVTINAAAVSANYDLMLAGDGVLGLKETETPTADTNYGKLYTKNDNKLYFQDGAGTEHEIAYV